MGDGSGEDGSLWRISIGPLPGFFKGCHPFCCLFTNDMALDLPKAESPTIYFSHKIES